MMNKQASNKHQILETITDWLKILGLIGFPLWIIVFLIYCLCVEMCQSKHYYDTPASPTHEAEEIYREHSTENSRSVTRRAVTPVQSEENKLIDKLSKEDYYEYSDYYDGLDGEHSDIDFNEVRDYFED